MIRSSVCVCDPMRVMSIVDNSTAQSRYGKVPIILNESAAAPRVENKEETIGIMCNACYGGFTLSNGALDEYSKRLQSRMSAEEHKLFLARGGREMSRTDQVMVNIVEEMGSKAASGYLSNVVVTRFEKRYEKYLKISEYDGSETPWVDLKKYLLDQLKSVLMADDEAMSSDDKIEAMKKLFKDELIEDFHDDCY